ncbi:MAG: hypothetical protein MZV64_17530 [Ignavibacteriales bacterium]|nr:hypothetical protein [Ignavibacteriales bacterium]
MDREQAKKRQKPLFDKGNWVGEMTASRRKRSRFEAQVSRPSCQRDGWSARSA